MDRDRKNPESIKRKRQRTPEEMEEIRRRRRTQERMQSNQRKSKRTPEEIEELRRRRRIEERRQEMDHNSNRYSQRNNNQRIDMPNNKIKKGKVKKKKSFMSRVFKAILWLLLAIIILTIIMIGSFLLKVKTSDMVAGVDPGPNDPVNILVLGMDIGDVEQVENTDIKRTDTIMLINYNPNTKKTQIVSIPRDTLVTINGKNYKMNAIYQLGGNSRVRDVVEDMLDITVNYMINIDYEAFRGFIDAIGGIDMEIERDMIYDDDAQDLHINFKAGTIEHLDGKKAEEFFRWRKNNDGTGFAMGDLGRIENQHKFLTKVVDKCKNPLILLRAPKIIDVVASNIETNMPASKMLTYGLKVMFSMKNGVNMTTIANTPEYIGDISYVIFDKEDNQELIESLNSGKVFNSELSKKDAKVIILNGANKNGLASQVRTDLATDGFEDVEVGNTEETSKSIVMTDYENLKEEILELLPKISKSDGKYLDEEYSSYDVVIILGSDYKR